MFIEQLFRKPFARSNKVPRATASRVLSALPARRSDPRRTLNLDELRVQVEQASHRVLESERLVAGWQELIESERIAGRDPLGHDLLKQFQTSLEEAMTDMQVAEQAVAQRLLDLFQGARGRLPENDQELHAWLSSPEGKAATAFELTSVSPWGDRGRS